MNAVFGYFRELTSAAVRGWNRFWFVPVDPATLGLVRIFAGMMLLYTHLVWGLDLEGFFGNQGWLSPESMRAYLFQPPPDVTVEAAGQPWEQLPRFAWAPSHFWLVQSPAGMWTVHVIALVVFLLLTLGLFTRVVSVLAFLFALSYIHRVPAGTFGLDQINALLAMYLMVGPAGAWYSLDRLLAGWRSPEALPPAEPRAGANIAIRLIQVHMCVIYFFAGASKLLGDSWWDGTAIWMSMANAEYQTIDMYWLAWYPEWIDLATVVTVAWELFFCVLIWPRLTRPLMLAGAVVLHLGIGICLGMMTFGLVMLIGCLAFVPPEVVRSIVDRLWPFSAGRSSEKQAERTTSKSEAAAV